MSISQYVLLMIVPPAKEELPSVFWCWPGWLLTRYLTDSLRAMLSCSRPPSRRQVVGRFTLMKIGQLSVSLYQLELAVGLCCGRRRRSVREFISFRVVCFDFFFLLMKGFDSVYVLWSVGLFVKFWKDRIKVFWKDCWCVCVLTRTFTKDCLVKKRVIQVQLWTAWKCEKWLEKYLVGTANIEIYLLNIESSKWKVLIWSIQKCIKRLPIWNTS